MIILLPRFFLFLQSKNINPSKWLLRLLYFILVWFVSSAYMFHDLCFICVLLFACYVFMSRSTSIRRPNIKWHQSHFNARVGSQSLNWFPNLNSSFCSWELKLTVTTCWLFLGEFVSYFCTGKKSYSHRSALSFEKIVLVLLLIFGLYILAANTFLKLRLNRDTFYYQNVHMSCLLLTTSLLLVFLSFQKE